MTWHDTFPDPTMYYHAPEKFLQRNTTGRSLDGRRSVLQLWTPQRRHEYSDPYHPEQRGHLARLTLKQWNGDGYGVTYDVHHTKNGVAAIKDITAIVGADRGQRPMTMHELEWLASIAREELRDYALPATMTGRVLEAVTGYRHRAQRRMLIDLDRMVNDYYAQEAGKTITIQ